MHYGPYSQVVYYPGQGLVEYCGAEPEFTRYDSDCRPVRRFRLDTPPVPVTEADRQAVMEYNRRRVEASESETSRRFAEAELKHATFADQMPFYGSVGMDEFGYFWVSPPPAAPTMDRATESGSMILSPDGEYLGGAMLPTGIIGRSGTYIGTRRENEQTGDYDYIVYRMESAVPGFVYP